MTKPRQTGSPGYTQRNRGNNPGTGGGWSLDAFMAAQADGLYFDTTKTDRFFQENTGPTLADDVGEAIGLAMSQRAWNGQTLAQVLAAATELEVDANWTLGTNASRVGGTITQPTNTASYNYQLVPTVADRLYRVRFTIAEGGFFCGVWSGVPTSNIITSIGGMGVGTHERYFVAVDADATFSFTGTSAGTNQITGISVKEIPGKHGIQATGTLKPTRQTTGAKFDGADDNWLTSYMAGAGDQFAFVRTTVPASIASNQVIFGAQNAGAEGAYGAVTTGGALRVKIGSTTIDSTGIDLRDGEHVIGFWIDGGTVYLYADGAIVGSGAFSGSLPSATAWRIGALNNNGSGLAYYGGSMHRLVAGRDTISISRANQIRNALLA